MEDRTDEGQKVAEHVEAEKELAAGAVEVRVAAMSAANAAEATMKAQQEASQAESSDVVLVEVGKAVLRAAGT